MGDTFKREFSLDPVDTGRRQSMPNQPWSVPGMPDPTFGAGTPQPGMPLTRPSFLTSFLANLPVGLAGGLSFSDARGNQGIGTGLAGGLLGIQTHNQQQLENTMRLQTLQRQAAQEARTGALQAAETERLKRLTPLEVKGAELDLERQTGLLSLAGNPAAVEQMLGPLRQNLGTTTGDEEAILQSGKAATVANLRQGKFDLGPYNAAIDKVAQGRLTRGKSGAQVEYNQGIPVSIRDKNGNTYDVNDPKLPAELKPLIESAKKSHSEHLKEEADKQGRAFAQQMAIFQKRLDMPTQTTKTMIDTAPGVSKLADKVIEQVKSQQQKLGPAIGRWNDFWTNKVGSPNPEFKQLTANSILLRSLLAKMHIGSRPSEYLLKEFLNLLDAGKDSPENMLAAAETIKSYADDIAGQAKDFGMKRKQGGGGLKIIRDKDGRISDVQIP